MINLDKGKIPPQAVDLEEIVIGALLISESAIEEAIEIGMHLKVFYKNSHSLVFKAITELYDEREPIDLMTVVQRLRKNGDLEKVGNEYALIQFTQKVSSSAHLEYHCRILMQKYIQRELIISSNKIIENSYSEEIDVFDLLDKSYSNLNSVSEVIIKNKKFDIQESTAEILEFSKKLFEGQVKPGIETPITNLTDKMGGWRDEELIILAARPGMGKTAFALKSGWVSAINGTPAAFFSLEMSENKLLSRLWSMECKIENEKFNKNGLSPEERKKVLTRMSELGKIPFYIDDTPGLNVQTLRVKVKRLVKNYGVKLVIVDYLQLMSGPGANKEQQISEISRGIKSLALELKIPIIALSQLSRAVETRGGSKRPLLSDLRDSGAIEQDADVVMFIYRPEYYHIEEWEEDYNREPTNNQAEYIVAKNRNGGLVRNRMRFQGQYTSFSNLEDYEDESFFQNKREEEYIPEAPAPNHNLKAAFGSDNDPDDLPF